MNSSIIWKGLLLFVAYYICFSLYQGRFKSIIDSINVKSDEEEIPYTLSNDKDTSDSISDDLEPQALDDNFGRPHEGFYYSEKDESGIRLFSEKGHLFVHQWYSNMEGVDANEVFIAGQGLIEFGGQRYEFLPFTEEVHTSQLWVKNIKTGSLFKWDNDKNQDRNEGGKPVIEERNETLTRAVGDSILVENGFYQTPVEYREYYAQKFDEARELAIKEGRTDDVKKLDDIQTNKSHGIGECIYINNTPQGIMISTREWIIIDNNKQLRPIVLLYTNYDDRYENGTLTRINELNSYAVFDYSFNNQLVLVGLYKPIPMAESISREFYTYNLNTKELKVQFKLYTDVYGAEFSPRYDSIRYKINQKNPKTADNPMGVGSEIVTKTIKLK